NQWSTITVPKEGQVKLDGITTEQMKKLITFCRSVDMTPIIGFKIIGKQGPILGKLAKKYPGLLVKGPHRNQKVINPAFRFPDGRDVYEAAVFPIMNTVISWY